MYTKRSSRPVSLYGSVFLALGMMLATQPAYAGFQWISPAPSPAEAEQQVPPPAPQAYPPVQIIEGAHVLPAPPVAPTAPIAAKPLKMQETVSHPAAPEPEQVVRGFADNVPLSVALRQVLPQEVGFSVAQDVSLGTLVSWKGGSPWRQVMKEMLLPAGLSIKEQGQLVHVVRATETSPALTSTLSVPPAKATLPPMDGGKPMALLPPASNLPVRSIPEHGAPLGAAGYLAPPPGASSPLPVSMPAPYVMDKTIDAWTGNKGDTLQKVLEAWAHRAHVELSWQAEYDFPLQASVTLNGSFEEAVRGMLGGFQEARPQPVGFLYNNQAAGQTVLVIQTRGNNYNE